VRTTCTATPTWWSEDNVHGNTDVVEFGQRARQQKAFASPKFGIETRRTGGGFAKQKR